MLVGRASAMPLRRVAVGVMNDGWRVVELGRNESMSGT